MTKIMNIISHSTFIPFLLLVACSQKDEARKPVDTTLPEVNAGVMAPPTDTPSDASSIPDPATSTADQTAPTSNMAEFSFGDFPSEIFSGARVAPDFNGPQRQFREFRTMISDGVKQGPVYAGSVAISTFGCGTDCSMGYATDLQNGMVVPLPVGGEANSDLALEYHPGSRLLKAAWKGAANDYSGPPTDCSGFAYFEWTGREFKTLKVSSHSPACE
jgi:hypothetical protein